TQQVRQKEQSEGKGEEWTILVRERRYERPADLARCVVSQAVAQPTLLERVSHIQASHEQKEATQDQHAQNDEALGAILPPGYPDHWTPSFCTGGDDCGHSVACWPR